MQKNVTMRFKKLFLLKDGQHFIALLFFCWLYKKSPVKYNVLSGGANKL